jgi:hypothetical protein
LSKTGWAESSGSFGGVSTAAREGAADKASAAALMEIKNSRKASGFRALVEEREKVVVILISIIK